MTDNESRKIVINDFLAALHENCVNKIEGDADLEDLFGESAPFRVVCNKCGGMNVEIIGEKGIDYGGYTGYSPGETVIKCIGCGAAASICN